MLRRAGYVLLHAQTMAQVRTRIAILRASLTLARGAVPRVVAHRLRDDRVAMGALVVVARLVETRRVAIQQGEILKVVKGIARRGDTFFVVSIMMTAPRFSTFDII